TRFDLLLDVTPVDGTLAYSLTYSTDLFDEATIAEMSADLATLLSRFTADPGQPLGAARAWLSRRTLDVVVVGTFTAEPLGESLSMWTRELGMLGRVKLAPYGQVFQELLDPTSQLGQNGEGANVLLVRFEDWMKGGQAEEDVEKSVEDLVIALKGATQRSRAPHVVVVCPPSPTGQPGGHPRAPAPETPEPADRSRRLEGPLGASLADAGGVHVLTSAEIGELYPVADVHDPYSDATGHIPYTPLYFAAIGTAVMRR